MTMSQSEVHVELLLNREVRDPASRRAGRIEEIRAVREGEEIVIEAYHLGPTALMERLAAPIVQSRLLRALGVRHRSHGRRARWDQMDLSDPEHPRLTCPVDELAKLSR
jgi:hypothetical protein